MSNYTQSTNFATKDSLPSGDPLKIVKGTEINTEFANIATAIATKADLSSPTLTGTPLAPTASSGTNTTQIATTAFVVTALQVMYPVGSIYINSGVSTNPATLMGFGTWVAFGAGKVMVGLDGSDTSFDTLEETGGSKDAITVSHTHTFSATTGNMSANASHAHMMKYTDITNENRNFTTDNNDSAQGYDLTGYDALNTSTTSTEHTHSVSGTTASTGSSGTNANLQPYITVAMWKRTA
jgi:hypothetical protein